MRKKPYTGIGISRVPCFKCGKPSSQQWSICCLNSEYKGVCKTCDTKLNRMVLSFMGFRSQDVERIIKNYQIA
ncbi:hypothetical protein LCGC14_0346020 [marine sediment metagenome]|uniref:Uncharacterized protein n=1 Tax=marine sediment metagenome TaxID=412755 RepID=A0A0F9TC72_9ZZZZ